MTADRADLLAAVYCRLYGDNDDDGRDLALTLPGYHLDLAKHQARNGNLEPLRKLNPEIAEFIAKPAQVKRVRRHKAAIMSIRKSERNEQIDTIRRIREILEEIEVRPSHDLVVEIAAKVLKLKPEIISKIIHRGMPR
jgi:hypothetical protein